MSSVNNERLISLVKERPPLYDYSHPAHCNRDVTCYMWAEIAAELDTTEVFCKTKWANLRSNFVRELRRLRPSDDGTIWPPQWPLFKPLMFLLPFLKKRGASGSSVEEPTMLHLNTEKIQEPKKHSVGEFSTDQVAKKIRLDSLPAEQEPDDDKLFMLSLVSKMKRLPTIDNLNFRIEVQQLLLSKLRQSSDGTSVQEAVQVLLQVDEDDNSYQGQIVKEENDDE